jgi:hypothetical protein
MLALIILTANAPTLLCIGASAYLAAKGKSQWPWFAAMSFFAAYGGIFLLNTVNAWQLAARG